MKERWILISILLLIFSFPGCECRKRWDVLSPEEKVTLYRTRTHWEAWVPARKKDGTAPLMTFEELYAGLDPGERAFLDRIRSIHPKKDFDFSAGGGPASGGQVSQLGGSPEEVRFKRIAGQIYRKTGEEKMLDPQYLPEEVYEDYELMMQAMEEDLGRRLLVESGHRSPAYQLYTFLFYLPKHRYSLVETGHWVALPGYSEHGAPHRQAIDFINQEGVNGENNVEEFTGLPEYGWLVRNAEKFGFKLSYPRGRKGVTFEPWHWRWIRGTPAAEDR